MTGLFQLCPTYCGLSKEIDKGKEINIDKRAFGEPKFHFVSKILIQNKYIESNNPVIGRFNLLATD